MALGGGSFITENKVLPGAYINFVSAARASAALSERGVAAIPIEADWGPLGEAVEIATGNSQDMQRTLMRLFGREFTDPRMRDLRELMRNVRLAYVCRLGTGGAKASNGYGTARHVGERGNDITIVVSANVDDPASKDVVVLLGGSAAARQTVADASALADDDFVVYEKGGDLEPTAGTPMVGGSNPTVAPGDYVGYLDLMEGHTFNAIGCPSADPVVKAMFAAFTRRMREEQGVKFQCVMHNPDANSDHEGVIDVLNAVTDDGAAPGSLVYWVTGVAAGTAVNRSALNKAYDGEYVVGVGHTQTQLEAAIRGGKFAFHRVHGAARVLADVNSLTTLTEDKNELFQENQTIRVIDQIANDIAYMFNTRYLGNVPNDESGRVSLWADIVRHHEQLQTMRAIEGFTGEDVAVEQGGAKRAVRVTDKITVVNAMAILYMVVTVA